MRVIFNKFLAVMLILAIGFNTAPVNVFADDIVDFENNELEEEYVNSDYSNAGTFNVSAIDHSGDTPVQTYNVGYPVFADVTASVYVNAEDSSKYDIILSGTGETMGYEGPYDTPPWRDTYREDIVNIVIEDGVTSIGSNAFRGCDSLVNVYFPDSLESIGDFSFIYCPVIEEFFFPESLVSIGQCAFGHCDSLKIFNIPKNVSSIDRTVMDGCTSVESITVDEDNTSYDSRSDCNAIIESSTGNLIRGCENTVIPDGVIKIDSFSFTGCKGIESISIPASVTSVNGSAFIGCSAISSFTVDENNTVYDSRDNCEAVIETSSNMLVVGCKNTVIPESVTSIGSSAFYENADITEVKFGPNLTSIGHSAFSHCTGLKSITLPDSVTTIDDYAFSCCTSLTEINLGSGIENIGEYIFHCWDPIPYTDGSEGSIPTKISVKNSALDSYDWAQANRDIAYTADYSVKVPVSLEFVIQDDYSAVAEFEIDAKGRFPAMHVLKVQKDDSGDAKLTGSASGDEIDFSVTADDNGEYWGDGISYPKIQADSYSAHTFKAVIDSADIKNAASDTYEGSFCLTFGLQSSE